MKKNLLIIFAASLLISACKKEAVTAPSAPEPEKILNNYVAIDNETGLPLENVKLYFVAIGSLGIDVFTLYTNNEGLAPQINENYYPSLIVSKDDYITDIYSTPFPDTIQLQKATKLYIHINKTSSANELYLWFRPNDPYFGLDTIVSSDTVINNLGDPRCGYIYCRTSFDPSWLKVYFNGLGGDTDSLEISY